MQQKPVALAFVAVLLVGACSGSSTDEDSSEEVSVPVGLPLVVHPGLDAGEATLWDFAPAGDNTLPATPQDDVTRIVIPESLDQFASSVTIADSESFEMLPGKSAVTDAAIWPIVTTGIPVGYFTYGPYGVSATIDIDGDNTVDVWDVILLGEQENMQSRTIATTDISADFVAGLEDNSGTESWCQLAELSKRAANDDPAAIEMCELPNDDTSDDGVPLRPMGSVMHRLVSQMGDSGSDLPTISSQALAGGLPDEIVNAVTDHLKKHPKLAKGLKSLKQLQVGLWVLEYDNKAHESPCERLGSGACQRPSLFPEKIDWPPEDAKEEEDPDPWDPQVTVRWPDGWENPDNNDNGSGSAQACPIVKPPGWTGKYSLCEEGSKAPLQAGGKVFEESGYIIEAELPTLFEVQSDDTDLVAILNRSLDIKGRSTVNFWLESGSTQEIPTTCELYDKRRTLDVSPEATGVVWLVGAVCTNISVWTYGEETFEEKSVTFFRIEENWCLSDPCVVVALDDPYEENGYGTVVGLTIEAKRYSLWGPNVGQVSDEAEMYRALDKHLADQVTAAEAFLSHSRN